MEQHTKWDDNYPNASWLSQDDALQPALKIHCPPVELKAAMAQSLCFCVAKFLHKLATVTLVHEVLIREATGPDFQKNSCFI